MGESDAVVMGIDPGLKTTGYSLIRQLGIQEFELVEGGVIVTKESDSLPHRLKTLSDGLGYILKSCFPEALALEELFSHYAFPTTAILMGHARGVICCEAARHNIPLFSYPTTLVKKTVTGNGRASKEQVLNNIAEILRIDSRALTFDIADACAMALTHLIRTISKYEP